MAINPEKAAVHLLVTIKVSLFPGIAELAAHSPINKGHIADLLIEDGDLGQRDELRKAIEQVEILAVVDQHNDQAIVEGIDGYSVEYQQ